ncbi:MAG TPA: 3'-5' exonuclease [Candidatus Didemnitutus sp.]|nr:3'-5' exonuclease [Candidatus Didemnitutus sp.]
MSWRDTPIHFVDFEGGRVCGILEFGVVTLRGGAVESVRTGLCRPLGRIPAEDSEIHGLREADLAQQRLFSEEWEFFARLRETGPLAAHFAGVENGLLKSVWPYPRTAPDFAQPGRSAGEWGPWIDTGRLYPQFFPEHDSARLESLVQASGLAAELSREAEQWCPPPRRRFHAALYDALAGSLLLLTLLRRPEFEPATIPWLLQMSTLNPDKRRAMQQGGLF